MKEPLHGEGLLARYRGFPDISYRDFKMLPGNVRRTLIANNRVIGTDTYNRTMEHLMGNKWSTPATYVLQMRTAKEGYLIAYGIREQLENIASLPISQSELDFATEFYTSGDSRANIPYFNRGKWQDVIDNHGGRLPIDVRAVPDGTALLPGDPVMRVTGPNELVAHFEPSLHRVFYPSRVATIAHEIDRTIGGQRFIEVGKRGTPTEEVHLIATAAMFVGGGINLTSNDSAAVCYDELGDVGTIGHRYVQSAETEAQAFQTAIENLGSVSLLVDLHNSLHGIDLAVAMKRRYKDSGKKIWIRLDSGDVSAQTLYALQAYAHGGFTRPGLDRIVVEGIETVEEMAAIDKRVAEAGFDPKQYVIYGAGGLLVSKHTERSDASTGFKLSRYGGRDTMKHSDSPGKESLPGEPTLVEVNGRRVIAQVGEFPDAKDLLVPALQSGQVVLSGDLQTARATAQSSFAAIQDRIGERSTLSDGTKRKMENLIFVAPS